MSRAALYLRVSKDDSTTENQRPDVEQIARARKLDVVQLYEETASAAKHRPEYERMMVDARAGRFGVLVIWALDRFGRSMLGNMQAVVELDRLGVQVISVREPWLDTAGPTRALLVAIFSWCAEQERHRLIERTRAGLDRARREGKKLGRPRTVILDFDELAELRASGVTIRGIASKLDVSPAAVQRALGVPPSGVCGECSAHVVRDLHGRAAWHCSPGSRYACAGTGQPAALAVSKTPHAS